MTTAIAIQSQQVLPQSLPVLGLQLLNNRHFHAMVKNDHGEREVVRVQNPPLTAEERSALEQTALVLRDSLSAGRRSPNIAVLARLANHRSKEKTPQEWQMLFEDFAEDLEEFSNAHVREAVIEHRRNSNWFPSIAEIRTRCRELVERDKFRLERAERMLSE